MAAIPGSVRVTGIIAPTDSTDTYAVTDTRYGIDGLRNFTGDTSELLNITAQRRRSGMIVGIVSGDTRLYYRLQNEPWSFDMSDWVQLTLYDFTGNTNFTTVEAGYWISGATGTGLLNVEAGHSVFGQYSIAAAGSGNTIYGDYSVSVGGLNNVISAITSNISSAAVAGFKNLVEDGVVIGGLFNTASTGSISSVLAGGLSNKIDALTSFLGGGANNSVENQGSAILAGNNNRALGSSTAIVGGVSNTAQTTNSIIIGGSGNKTIGSSSIILGGQNNLTEGVFSSAIGVGLISQRYGQVVVGTNNIPQGVELSESSTDYNFIVGGGNASLNTRSNALAIRRDGLIQTKGFSGSTLPTTVLFDGALAYSANTGFYQRVGTAWKKFASTSESLWRSTNPAALAAGYLFGSPNVTIEGSNNKVGGFGGNFITGHANSGETGLGISIIGGVGNRISGSFISSILSSQNCRVTSSSSSVLCSTSSTGASTSTVILNSNNVYSDAGNSTIIGVRNSNIQGANLSIYGADALSTPASPHPAGTSVIAINTAAIGAYNSSIIGAYGLVNGNSLVQSGNCQVVFGQYNIAQGARWSLIELGGIPYYEDNVFIIGNGTGAETRSNAFSITHGGLVQLHSLKGSLSGNNYQDGAIIHSGNTGLYQYVDTEWHYLAPKRKPDVQNSITTTTLDYHTSKNFDVTLTANTTIEFNNLKSGDEGKVVFKQDGSGGHTVTFPFGSIFEDGASTLSTTASAINLAAYYYDGTNYFWRIKTYA